MFHSRNMFLLRYCRVTDEQSPQGIATTAFDGFVTDVTSEKQIPLLLHTNGIVTPCLPL